VALEQEVKLAFDSVEAARQAVTAAGGRLAVAPRLLDDRLFDTADQRLRRLGCAFRIRRDGASTIVTFKGPAAPGPVKSREEIETTIAGPEPIEALFAALEMREWFRGQKYREEYRLDGILVTVDDTPIGVFVEIEAPPEQIAKIAARLGRTPADYGLESYPKLYFDWCEARGIKSNEMVFGERRDEY